MQCSFSARGRRKRASDTTAAGWASSGTAMQMDFATEKPELAQAAFLQTPWHASVCKNLAHHAAMVVASKAGEEQLVRLHVAPTQALSAAVGACYLDHSLLLKLDTDQIPETEFFHKPFI